MHNFKETKHRYVSTCIDGIRLFSYTFWISSFIMIIKGKIVFIRNDLLIGVI